jgi:hypothetical protein
MEVPTNNFKSWEEQDMEEKEQLRRVRTAGHTISSGRESNGRAFLQIVNYRTGPRYGLWSFEVDPEGDNVKVEHSFPAEYRRDGTVFVFNGPHEAWTFRVEDWRRHPARCCAELLGDSIGRVAGPLLALPEADDVAPDAYEL